MDEEFIKKVMEGYYTEHPKGEDLLRLDLDVMLQSHCESERNDLIMANAELEKQIKELTDGEEHD